MKKQLYSYPDDYAVRSEIGELVCKIAALKKGYYIYNKLGEQIAQVTFYDNTANITVGYRNSGAMNTAKLIWSGTKNIEIVTNQIDKGDIDCLENLKGGDKEKYSVWGDTSSYNYDIYEGNKIAANIVPSLDDQDIYLVRTGEVGNLLKVIMIVIASERLNYDMQN